jgi:hypothetical protein
VAKKLGMSRSTYGEHLRKAVNTLMDNSYPMLKLFAIPGRYSPYWPHC